MPLDNGEVLSRAVQQLRTACQDMRAATRDVASTKDTLARDRLRRTRLLADQCHERVKAVNVESEPALRSLMDEFTTLRAEYDTLNAEATRKEKQSTRSTEEAHATSLEAEATQRIRLQDIRPIDLSEFETEEAIQREKLQSAREIESDVMDLKTTYQDFHTLVHQQQEGITVMASNVDESHNLVERGHDQILQASRHQKSFRKIGCGVGVVVVIVIIVVILLVLFLT